MYPLKNIYVTSPFGWRIHPITKKNSHHDGVDLRASKGTEVFAIANGIVKAIYNFGAYGKQVFIEHSDGALSHHAHLSEFKVKERQVVEEGQVIALSGNSGTYTTGPHLHFGIKKDGQWIDPLKYLEGLEMEKATVRNVYSGVEYEALYHNGKTYVELRPFAPDHGIPILDWDNEKRIATVGGGLVEGLNELVKKYKKGVK